MSRPAAAAAAGSDATASSGSKRPFPRAAGDSGRRVHPRPFHAGRNPVAAAASAGDDAAAAEADRPPPAARLYRHALESIFGWLNQREVVAALQVSKSWLAAVESMASLQLAVEQTSAPLREVALSVMGRHVAELGEDESYVSVTADSLFTVARLMPQLHVLWCDLELTPSQGPLTFPPGLREMHLSFDDYPAADVNAALRVISRLPLLEALCLHLDDFDELSFAPLVSLPLLRDLVICQLEDDYSPAAKLSDAQVAQLRAMPLLQRLGVDPMPTSLLRRLLAQPHELQWQWIGLPIPFCNEAASLLPRLPSLTALHDLRFAVVCSSFDFLRQLPKLTHASLKIRGPSVAGRMESLIGALQGCSQIQELTLDANAITAAHLAEMLPRLPRLRSLWLNKCNITTLAFLAQPPMTQQLTGLYLEKCKRLPLTELRHVHALRGLKSLSLSRSFNEPMGAHCESLYAPPSLLLPQLEDFDYEQP